jgi:hypothetical protein
VPCIHQTAVIRADRPDDGWADDAAGLENGDMRGRSNVSRETSHRRKAGPFVHGADGKRVSRADGQEDRLVDHAAKREIGEQEVRGRACVETRFRSGAGIRPTASWLVVSKGSCPGDAGEAAAVVLATQEFVANGVGRRSDRRHRSAASPGRTGSRGRVGRRRSWRSIAELPEPSVTARQASPSGR